MIKPLEFNNDNVAIVKIDGLINSTISIVKSSRHSEDAPNYGVRIVDVHTNSGLGINDMGYPSTCLYGFPSVELAKQYAESIYRKAMLNHIRTAWQQYVEYINIGKLLEYENSVDICNLMYNAEVTRLDTIDFIRHEYSMTGRTDLTKYTVI